jgi:anti-sigma-K factor RskA
MIPTDPAERAALAGEYVLGTLDARTAAAMRAAIETDAGLRAEVEAWERRLAPLADTIAPADPPADLLPRIEAALDARAAAPARVVPLARAPRANLIWKVWAASASALASGLAAFMLLRPAAEEPRYLAVLQQDRGAPAWVVEASPSRGIVLAGAVNPRPVQEGRVLQLWGLAPGAAAPVSLGIVPPDGRLEVDPRVLRPEDGMLVEISLEPPGGSPTGRPTGPVLFIGRLERVE